jgi:hypothetical protein
MAHGNMREVLCACMCAGDKRMHAPLMAGCFCAVRVDGWYRSRCAMAGMPATAELICCKINCSVSRSVPFLQVASAFSALSKPMMGMQSRLMTS